MTKGYREGRKKERIGHDGFIQSLEKDYVIIWYIIDVQSVEITNENFKIYMSLSHSSVIISNLMRQNNLFKK